MNNRYKVIMNSDEYGMEEFEYESLPEALAGMMRLVRAGIENGDGVERWFSVREAEEEEE